MKHAVGGGRDHDAAKAGSAFRVTASAVTGRAGIRRSQLPPSLPQLSSSAAATRPRLPLNVELWSLLTAISARPSALPVQYWTVQYWRHVTILALTIALPIVEFLSLHFTKLINNIHVWSMEWNFWNGTSLSDVHQIHHLAPKTNLKQGISL